MDNQQQPNQEPISSLPSNSTVPEQTIPTVPEEPAPTIPAKPAPVTAPEIPVSPLRPKIPVETPVEPPITPESPEATPAPSQYQPVLDQFASSTPQPPTTETPTSLRSSNQTDYFASPTPRQSSAFPKIIFIISLIIFIFVFTALVFVFYKSQSPTSNTSKNETPVTPTPSFTCNLNDKNYQANESFTAEDGCNTCTCVSQDVITCSENTCMETTPATKSGTKTNKTQ